MILDIFISIVLSIFIVFPKLLKSMNTPIGKLICLLIIYLIVQQNAMLGLVAGVIFMVEIFKPTPFILPKRKSSPSLLPIDETIRPKNSNSLHTNRNSITPPLDEISGSIPGPVANNTIGSYTQINL
jgi:hypothetical protein